MKYQNLVLIILLIAKNKLLDVKPIKFNVQMELALLNGLIAKQKKDALSIDLSNVLMVAAKPLLSLIMEKKAANLL